MTGPIAYLTGQYPRATDTFIQREVAALRAQGFEVMTATMRATDASHHVGPEQRAEHAATFQVMGTAKNPAHLLRAHAAQFSSSPGRWGRALALAFRARPPGLKALVWQMFYFLEAGVLAHHMTRQKAVHLHNHFGDSSCSVAMIASTMSGIPYSLTLHGPAIFFAPEYWRIDEKIARAAFVSCISHFCRAQAMLFSDRTHWPRLKIVHCGVDPAMYGQDPDRAYAKRLLFVGRLDAVKGVPLLLDGFAEILRRHPDASLHIVGDGPDRTALEAQARALQLEAAVTFMGYRSQGEIADILTQTDVLVLPSFAEGLPVVLMEALAARVPVVCSQVAGVSELVVPEVSGFPCPAGDIDTMTTRIDQLLSDPDLCRQMGQAGRAAVVAEFDSTVEANWLGTLIKTSLEGALPDRLRPKR